MKKTQVVGMIAVLHVVVIGLMVMQGCRTTPPPTPPPEAAPMPPAELPETQVRAVPVRPPAPIEWPQAVAEPKIYVVKTGDSLGLIAKRFNVTVRDIVEMNKLTNPNKIHVGQKLQLPGYVDLNAPEPARPARKKPAPAAAKPKEPVVAGGGEYIVKSGDSLSKIAHQQGTTVRALKELNKLTSDRIRVGQKLALPRAAGASAVAAPRPAVPAPAGVAAAAPVPADAVPIETPESAEVLHIVEPNQDLNGIAMMYGVRVEEIMKLNGLTSAEVTPGQTLKIPPVSEM